MFSDITTHHHHLVFEMDVWRYPFTVNSIATAHPGLPPYILDNPNLDIVQETQAGDPFDPNAALRAEPGHSKLFMVRWDGC
jgi:hypothetical protein